MSHKPGHDRPVCIILAATACLFLGIGCVGILDPRGLMAPVGVYADSVSGVNELRANYGTLQIGLGLLVLYAARTPDWYRFGLLLGATYMGGLLAGRLLGWVQDGNPGLLIVLVAAAEVVGVAFNLGGWIRLRWRDRTLRQA